MFGIFLFNFYLFMNFIWFTMRERGRGDKQVLQLQWVSRKYISIFCFPTLNSQHDNISIALISLSQWGSYCVSAVRYRSKKMLRYAMISWWTCFFFFCLNISLPFIFQTKIFLVHFIHTERDNDTYVQRTPTLYTTIGQWLKMTFRICIFV